MQARRALDAQTALNYAVHDPRDDLMKSSPPYVDKTEFEWRLSKVRDRHERMMNILDT